MAAWWELGFRGEKMAKEGFVDLNWGVGPGELRNLGTLQRATNLFAVQMLFGVVVARNSAKWEFLAFRIAVK